MRWLPVFLLSAALLAPLPLPAQLTPSAATASPLFQPAVGRNPGPERPESRSGSTLVFAGVTGMAVGFAAGAVVGVGVAGCSDTGEGYCSLGAGAFGGLAGATIGIPLAVHLVNHRRGSLSQEVAFSSGLFLAGLAFTAATDEAVVLLMIPLAQIAGSIWMESKGTEPGER